MPYRLVNQVKAQHTIDHNKIFDVITQYSVTLNTTFPLKYSLCNTRNYRVLAAFVYNYVSTNT